jgi:O-methyltransferase
MTADPSPEPGASETRFDMATVGHPLDDPELRNRFFEGMEDFLTGYGTEDPPMPGHIVTTYNADYRDEGLDWPATALTMVGRRRLRNFRLLIERVVREEVPGDIIETGVWRGGASILARAVLAALRVTDRKLIVADSFDGLPPPDPEKWPADEGSNLHTYHGLAISLDQVRANFERFGLLDDQVVFLQGWFRDTMPRVPATTLSIIRLDGDMYESTIDPLIHLYDRLSVGGWVIVDDYYLLESCAAAVHDFFAMRGINPQVQAIDRVGSCFQKTS